MKNSTYEVRLAEWSSFRQSLEISNDPIQDVIDYYKQVPVVSIHTDPYDMSSWPDPWELVYENEYCEYCILLGMCYTLQLTDRFSQSDFEIHISTDKTSEVFFYPVFVDNHVLCYEFDEVCQRADLPTEFISQRIYRMPRLQ